MLPILRGMTKGSTRGSGRNRFVAPVAFLVLLILIGQAFWLTENRALFSPFAIDRIPCDKCARRGTVRDAADSRIVTMCPVCFGIGSHMIRWFDDLDVVCAPCGGMGRVDEEGVWRTCRRCDGRGLHRANDWQKIVPVDTQKSE